jgi:hypothetical protein
MNAETPRLGEKTEERHHSAFIDLSPLLLSPTPDLGVHSSLS